MLNTDGVYILYIYVYVCLCWHMQLVNHGIPERVIERALEGIADFFNLTDEEKRELEKKDSTDRIRWGLGISPGTIKW